MKLKSLIILFMSTNLFLYSQWSHRYATELHDFCVSISLADNGYYLACGFTSSTIMVPRWIALSKIDIRGNIVWYKAFREGEWDTPYQVIKTKDGGALLTGSIRSNGWVCKFNSQGEIEWQKSFWDYLGSSPPSVIEVDDGYIFTLSVSLASTESKILILKSDKKGNLLWQKCYGGTLSHTFKAIANDEDGGFIATGYSSQSIYAMDVIVVKFDREGNIIWQKKFGGEEDDRGAGIVSTNDGYVLCASTKSFGRIRADIWIVKLDKKGKIIWQKILGTEEEDLPTSITLGNDGDFIVVGTTWDSKDPSEDGIVIKINETGDVKWVAIYGSKKRDVFNSAVVDEYGYIVVTGQTYFFAVGWEDSDGWVSRLDPHGKLHTSCDFQKQKNVEVSSTDAKEYEAFLLKKEYGIIDYTTNYQPKTIRFEKIPICEARIPDKTIFFPLKKWFQQ